LSVRRATIDLISFPPNYDDLEEPSFDCAITLPTLPNGAPTPAVTGSPTGASCPNIQTYYSDVVFDICGASKKILRQWVVVDWCTGEEVTDNQIIKILDTQAPICSAPQDFANEISTDQGECTGTFTVPAPEVIFECSDYNYTVGYKLRDENGDPFEDPIYDNVSYNPATGLYTIEGLPQDTSWIVYTLTDACGNSSMCFTEVVVEDTEAPTPVCEGYTVVGLEDIGWADIFATSIDDGSFDNCEVERYEVRRESTNCGNSSDLQFGEKVNFCCSDVSAGYIKVVLRVYDAAGNFNDCVVNVNVQDKLDPTITCPATATIECTQDYTDLSLTGQAVGLDNCSVEVTYTDVVALDDCGKGVVTRTWRAEDAQGRSATCLQTINVIDSTPFRASNISWPSDLEVDGCDPDGASPEDLGSFPIIFNDDCTNIAVSYDDDVFYNTPDYCIKVLRHWKVIDWCSYDPQNPEFYEFTQKIGFSNSVAPTIAACDDINVQSTNGDCQEEVSMTINANDDCTPSALLKYAYVIDANNDGSADYNGASNTFSRTLPAGTHKVTWSVTDACDNTSSCMSFITISDTKAPTPICIGEIALSLGEDGSVEIWASDFNLKSEAACGSDDDLTFAFDAAGTQTNRVFTCADLGNGIGAEIELEMHVFDASGNSEFCSVTLLLADNPSNDVCMDTEGMRAVMAGSITTSANAGIENIEVELMDMDAQEAEMEMTESEGNYVFDDVDFYAGYAVEPYKNDDTRNGVSTLDLVMIQRHILGLSELDSPYKLIAADVNGNEKVNSSDLLKLRKVILGIDDTFGENTSWKFIPTTHEIEDPAFPFGFPEKVVIDELYVSAEDIDFTAIKVGDINNSATVGLTGVETATVRSGAQSLMIQDQAFEAGQDLSVAIQANEISHMVGMQMTFAYDAKAMTYAGITSGDIAIADYNVNVTPGLVSISWNQASAQGFTASDVLMSIDFVANANGQLSDGLALTEKGLTPELYDEALQSYDLGLEFGSRNTEIVATTLYQNAPNPFKEMTTIGFDMSEKGMASIAIFDVAGKELYRMTNEFTKGYNAITIDVQSLKATTGILYYTLSTGEFTDTKKMIIVD